MTPMVHTICPACAAEVSVTAGEVLLWLAPGDPDGGGVYAFVCQTCATLADKPADRLTASLLWLAGVSPLPVTLHPEPAPPGPRLTANDLLDLLLCLARDDWFSRLSAAADSP